VNVFYPFGTIRSQRRTITPEKITLYTTAFLHDFLG
jgi:hypothetical protein